MNDHPEVIPLTEIERRGLQPHSAPPPPYVLVVDDERIIADTIVEILRKQNLAALAAYDAESALELAEVAPPNLLLSDVVLPAMNGVELAITVRRTIPDCEVLLFSGQAEIREFLDDAKQAGYSFNMLAKPVLPTDLVRWIQKLLAMTENGGGSAEAR